MTLAARATDLVLSHGKARALDGVSVELAAGARLGVLGPSGAGKTTLLRCLAGLAIPESGTIELAGERATAGGKLLLPPERRGVGLVFQSLALWPHMTVERTLRYVAQGTAEERRQRARELAERVGLGARLDAFPDALSGGEQQRLALARALAPRPRVLLLDEPFSHLDAPLRRDLCELVDGVLHEHEASLILVTHQPDEVFQLATQLLVLEDGQVCDRGELAERVARPGHRATVRLLGLGGVVWGHREGDTLSVGFETVEVDGPGDEALVRPDQVRVFVADEHGQDGTVRRCTLLPPGPEGPRYAVQLEAAGASGLIAHTREPWEVGALVRLKIEGPCVGLGA